MLGESQGLLEWYKCAPGVDQEALLNGMAVLNKWKHLVIAGDAEAEVGSLFTRRWQRRYSKYGICLFIYMVVFVLGFHIIVYSN
jgi:hypothetical protein